MKDLKIGPVTPRGSLSVDRGEQLISSLQLLISSLHLRYSQRVPNFGTANIAPSTLHQARYHIN
jgi:hypothetical protein